MNCDDVQPLLPAYFDGELDLVRHVQIEAHLAECNGCAEQEKQLRSLRSALSSPSLYYRAPAALRTRLDLPASPVPRSHRRSLVQRALLAAGSLLLIGISATFGVLLSRTGTTAEDRLTEWVVAGHVRSLQVDHLTDVASSDRHTVKPWFRGKIDFAPAVLDLAPMGYALTGGRLDYLVDRPVAALVYHRRLHAINLFLWPAGNEEEKAVRGLTRQGFHLRRWQQSGIICWAISDLNDEELDEFVRLVQAHVG
jgi:anti-sigma factor RsiW